MPNKEDPLIENLKNVSKRGLRPLGSEDHEKIIDLMNSLDNGGDQEKTYTQETAYSQQSIDIFSNFSSGSIKITKEIALTAKIAVEKRIESVKDYTKNRIERINNNYKAYFNDSSTDNANESQSNIFYPETFNSTEDWLDDLFLMFENLIDQLELEDIGLSLDEYIVKSLDITAFEDEKRMGMIRSLAKFLFKDKLQDKNRFYFQRKGIIKSLLKNALHKSDYKEKLLDFLFMGVISGEFCIRDNWKNIGKEQLCFDPKRKKEDNNNLNNPGFYLELDQEDVYKFTPVDTRLLIYPKTNRRWVVETINTTFHEILNIVLGSDDQPVEGSPYDLKMVKLLGRYLQEQGSSEVRKEDIHAELIDQEDIDNEENIDLWNIDGELTLYEAHNIPLVISNKVFKCMVTCVNITAKDSNSFELFPIGIQKTPYISGIPHQFTTFAKKDGDLSGRGIPELIAPLQKMLNDLISHGVDIMNLALWGIMAVDPDAFTDTTQLKEITPRMMLKLKNMKGRRVSDVIEWLKPDYKSLDYAQSFFNIFLETSKRTSRKGPTGEKIAPDPSATEAVNMFSELEKSVNKAGINLNTMLSKMLERIYIYNVLNKKELIKLRTEGYRIKGNEQDVLNDIEKGNTKDIDGKFNIIDKAIELTPEEIFVDNLRFKLNAVDTFNKKATEKQQLMQVINLLSSNSVIKNQDGTPHIMVDETGAEIFINEYKLYNRLLQSFGYDDVFDKASEFRDVLTKLSNPNLGQELIGQGQSQGGGNQVPPSTNPPDLTASTDMSDILNQTNLSQGINV